MAKASAVLFILLVMVATFPPSIACGYCPPSHGHPPKGGSGKPPSGGSPVVGPPKGGPGSGKPPSGGSPVVGPPGVNPPGGGIGGAPGTGTPGGGTPGTGTPGTGTPGSGTPGGGTPGTSCPINALKLGACVDVLGGLIHIGLGDPVVNQCCPLLQGVLALEAALCLCTTIRLKLLNLNIILPLALELFVQCGVIPPPGFTCPPLS
eukprot:Gb_33165 [translate_table: standard]